MATNKTQVNDASVDAFLEAIPDEARRKDCRDLAKLLGKVAKEKPRMWGAAMVGFGSYHYRYESGREGDSFVTGFASRRGDITVYLMGGFEGREALLAMLGRHKTGKACLYIRSLADIDTKVLETLLAASIADLHRLHPQA